MQLIEEFGNVSTLEKEVGGNTTLTYVISGTLETETAPYVKPLDDYWQYMAYINILTYASAFIFFLGILGNIFALIVLQRWNMRSSAVSFLLSVLAVSDTGCLCTAMVSQWILVITDFTMSIRAYNIYICRIEVFLEYTFRHLSPTTLMLVSAQRIISVYMPFKAKIICSRSNTIKVWSVIAGTIIALNSLAFFAKMKQIYIGEYKHCYYETSIEDWFYYVDGTLENFLPCTVIILGNAMIIIKMKYSRMKNRAIQNTTTTPSAGKTATDAMTKLLVIVTTSFVLLTTPSYALVKWRRRIFDKEVPATFYLGYSITYILLNLNFSINFILYCLFGRQFRESAFRILGRKNN